VYVITAVGKNLPTHVRLAAGAYPCELLERTCLHSVSRNPLELVELILRHSTFHAYYVNGRMIISEDLPTFEVLRGE
jgi:hypothetical protein